MPSFHRVNHIGFQSHVRDYLHDDFTKAMGDTLELTWEARGYLDTILAPDDIRDDFMALGDTNNVDSIPCQDLSIVRLRGDVDCGGARYLITARYNHRHQGFLSELSEMDAFRLAGVNPYVASKSQYDSYSSSFNTYWLQPKGDTVTPAFDANGYPNGNVVIPGQVSGLNFLPHPDFVGSNDYASNIRYAFTKGTVVLPLETIYDSTSGPLDPSLWNAKGYLNNALNSDFITNAAIGTLLYHGFNLRYIGGTFYKLVYTAEYSPGGFLEQFDLKRDSVGGVDYSIVGAEARAVPITRYISPLIAPPVIPLHTPKALIT